MNYTAIIARPGHAPSEEFRVLPWTDKGSHWETRVFSLKADSWNDGDAILLTVLRHDGIEGDWKWRVTDKMDVVGLGYCDTLEEGMQLAQECARYHC